MIEIRQVRCVKDGCGPCAGQIPSVPGWAYAGAWGDGDERYHTMTRGESAHDGGWSGYVPPPVKAPKATAEDAKAKWTREVWTGDGRGAVPIDYSRPEPASEALERHPAPEVPARRLEAAEIDSAPSAVRTLAGALEGAGWAWSVQHARGAGQHSTTGRPLAVKDRWAVVFRQGDWAGYAVYAGGQGGGWESISVRGVALAPKLTLGRTDLGVWLAGPGEVGAWWFEHIEALIEDKARAAKIKAKARGGTRKKVEVGG